MTRDLLPQALERARILREDEYADGLTTAEILALAAAVERAHLVHDNTTVDTPFTHGMRTAAKVVLGRIPVPDEWKAR